MQWLCGVVAGALHYLLLSVFCWMLAEGVMLYLLLVRVFGGLADKWYFFLPFGWGKLLACKCMYIQWNTDIVNAKFPSIEPTVEHGQNDEMQGYFCYCHKIVVHV